MKKKRSLSKFRMRIKPEMPIRFMGVKQENAVVDFMHQSLQDVINFYVDKNIEPKNVKISINYRYYDENSLMLATERPETDEEFDVRLAEYKLELKKWQKWFDENHHIIKAQEEKEKKAKLKDLLKKKKHIEMLIEKVKL